MGIHGLFDLIRGQGGGTKKVTLKDFAGKMIMIDAGAWSYRRFYTCHGTVVKRTDLAVSMPNPIDIRNEYFKKINQKLLLHLKHDTIPCFVFDGEAREEKAETRDERVSKKKDSIEKIEDYAKQLEKLENLEIDEEKVEEIRNLLMKTPHFNYKDLKAFQKFLDYLGLPWLIAKHDAEQLCAIMCLEGFAFATETPDGDGLAFGCPRIITETGNQWEKDEDDSLASPVYDMIELDDVLENLGLDFPAFVDMCILAKCDYNRGIRGISIKRAYEIIKHFGAIDRIPQDPPGNLDRAAMSRVVKGLPIKNSDYSLKLLRYRKCRGIFQFVSSDYFIAKGSYDMRQTNEPELNRILEKYSIKMSLSPLIRAKEKVSAPEVDDHHSIYLL